MDEPRPAHIKACPACGYDLGGLTGRVCPECGLDAVVEFERRPPVKGLRTAVIVLCGLGAALWGLAAALIMPVVSLRAVSLAIVPVAALNLTLCIAAALWPDRVRKARGAALFALQVYMWLQLYLFVVLAIAITL